MTKEEGRTTKFTFVVRPLSHRFSFQILHPRDDFYALAHLRVDHILLVVEVADTSIEYDRGEKLRRYAKAGILELWIVDVDNQSVEQYTQPAMDGITLCS